MIVRYFASEWCMTSLFQKGKIYGMWRFSLSFTVSSCTTKPLSSQFWLNNAEENVAYLVLAPVHSGLPLCETCLSSPHHWIDTRQAIFSTLHYQIQMEMTVGLWCRSRLRKKKKSSTFHRFSLSETGWSCTTPMRSIGQSCAVSGTLYLFFACLYTPLICKHLSAIFPCYFCLSFSELLSISAERHKNSSHEHFSNS